MNSISTQTVTPITTPIFEPQKASLSSSFVERSISMAERVADGNANRYRPEESSVMREGKMRYTRAKRRPRRIASLTATQTQRASQCLQQQGKLMPTATPLPLPKGCEVDYYFGEVDCDGAQIGDQGVKELAKLLMIGEDFCAFDLQENNITSLGANILSEAMQNNTSLIRLDLTMNDIGDAGARGLGKGLKNTVLQTLFLADNNIADRGAQELGEGLKNNFSLQVLGLSSNVIDDVGAQGLSEGLKSNTVLQELYLDYNQIGDAGAQGLGEAIKNNTALQQLTIDFNQIGNVGAQGLGEAIKHNTVLQELSLSFNQIGDMGAEKLGEAIKNNIMLRQLFLENNLISEKVCKELESLDSRIFCENN